MIALTISVHLTRKSVDVLRYAIRSIVCKTRNHGVNFDGYRELPWHTNKNQLKGRQGVPIRHSQYNISTTCTNIHPLLGFHTAQFV